MDSLRKLRGKKVTIFCMNYIYTGELVDIDPPFIHLKEASIVYETGPFTSKEYKDCQKFPEDWFINIADVESFGVLK